MSVLIVGICAASVFCALVSALSPEGGLGRYVVLACSLFTVLAVIVGFMPIGALLEEAVPDGFEAQETAEGSAARWLVEQTALEIGKSVHEYVKEKYGYHGTVSVTVDDADLNAVTVKRVIVDLTGERVTGGVYELEAELADALGCYVEVRVK